MDEPLNIAAIVPYPVYPAKMGGQKGIALFYQYLAEKIPVTIITTGKHQASDFASNFLPMLGTSKLRYINPLLFFKLKKIFATNKYSHLVLEHPYYGWLGIMLKRACKIKLVIHSHNIESLRFKSTGKWWWKILWNYEKFAHRNADINFFITDEDRSFGIKEFKLSPAKCHTITYGIEMNVTPFLEEKQQARKKINELYNIRPDEKLLFFNGTLSYKPNLDAVDVIIKYINPQLQALKNFSYKIIICGKSLPASYKNMEPWINNNIIYAGFVDDITIYFKAADIFINPVSDGGGIKTKLVEALGYNVSSVSTISGATGLSLHITGEKLHLVPDGDWTKFTNEIITLSVNDNTPETFYDHFFWGNIAKKVVDILN